MDVSTLDFFTIKETIKEFLQNQSVFSDYDFEGAGLSVLLDMLAYAAHYTGVYTNLAFAETFLDSAVQRSSVVSRAKEMGYTPRSKAASIANIRVSFSASGNPTQFVLPKGTQFVASSDSQAYIFVTTDDYIIENDGNDVFTEDIAITQGQYATISYTVDLTDASQRFTLGSKDVDTNYLSVLYKDNATSATTNQYSFIDDVDIGSLASDSQVYFLRETTDGFFEVYFGDDVIGKATENGNFISLSYIITDGQDANGASSFTLNSSITGVTGMSITTIDAAFGGSDIETTDSIKYLAPFYYQAQGRAVTTDDYIAIIKNTYSNVDDVTAWGGEDNDPPFYGKAFIAIKPKYTSIFSNSIKETIQNKISANYSIMTIRPEIVDPEYIDVSVDTTVTYNARLFSDTTNDELDADIRDSIETFFDVNANKFGQPLYFSKLVAAVDDTSDIVLNSINNLTLTKYKEIFSGISATYEYTFNNSIKSGAVATNEFTIDGVNYRIKDIPDENYPPHITGKLVIYRTSDNVVLSDNTGTVDYNTGVITIENLIIDSIVDDPFNEILTMSAVSGPFGDISNPTLAYTDNNVYTNERDELIRLKDGGISVTLLPDSSV